MSPPYKRFHVNNTSEAFSQFHSLCCAHGIVSSQVKYAKIRQKVYHLWASGKGHLATKYTSLTWLAGNRPVVFQAVAVAGHVNNLAVVDQTVQDRCGNRCIPQEVRPLIKALVGCNYQRRLL